MNVFRATDDFKPNVIVLAPSVARELGWPIPVDVNAPIMLKINTATDRYEWSVVEDDE